jgi:hypothetical protein
VTEMRSSLRRSRFKLLLLFLLFFLPALSAWLLIESGWRPGGMVNHGDLVQPVQPLAEAPLSTPAGEPVGAEPFLGHWTILVSAPGDCATACVETLDLVGRVHISLSKDMDRVRVGLVQPPDSPVPELLPERVLRLRAPESLLADWGSAIREPTVQLVDYRGMRMMSYPVPLDGSGLLKDLRRLLKLSNEEAERLRGREEDAR